MPVINGMSYLTPDELRHKLNISRTTYNRWLSGGKLKAYSFDGSNKKFFLETDLTAALKEVVPDQQTTNNKQHCRERWRPGEGVRPT